MNISEIYLYDPLGDYIKFRTDRKPALTERDFFLIDAHLPGVTVSEMGNKRKLCIMTVNFFYSSNHSIKKNGNVLEVYDQQKSEIPAYMFHLLHSIFNKHWRKSNIYSIHSACVYRNGHTMLLMGHSGFGKTTVSLNLLKQYDFKLICSDRLLLKIKNDGSVLILGGTKVVSYKQRTNIPLDILNNGTNYVDREVRPIMPEYIFNKYPKKIDSIVMMRLSDFSAGIAKIDPFEALLPIYSFFLDYWNNDVLIFNGLEMYDGINNAPIAKRKLLSKLRKLISKTLVVSISGSLQHIIHELDILVKKS